MKVDDAGGILTNGEDKNRLGRDISLALRDKRL